MDDIADVPLFSELRYDSLAVGDRWGPFVDSLDREASDRLRGSLSDSSPGTVAPLGVLPLLTLRGLRRALGGIVPGGVLIRQHFSLLESFPADAETEIVVWVSAQQQRPSGFYTTFSFEIAHANRTKAVVEWMILAPPDEEGTANELA